ncbi:MAG: glycosyl transferase family protein [Sphingobium sp.]
MDSWGSIYSVLMIAQREAIIFAAVGLFIGGLDDFLIDLLFMARSVWRKIFIYSRHARMTAATLPPSSKPGGIAIFVPAWHESAVIGAMLRAAVRQWGTDEACSYRIFVGAYPNDRDTISAIAAFANDCVRVQLVIHIHDGPTTKADCLNRLWQALKREEQATGQYYKAVVLHDAEDVVHRDELRLFDTMIDRFDMVQLPVRPLVSQQSRWIAGHYCDEFAESHGKTLLAREALGAAVPSAGVGCAFGRRALNRIAHARGGSPFDPASLTEDYEIGLRIAEMNGRTVFIRMHDENGELICTKEHFPETLDTAVNQKARWFIGISLAGWDRMGWHGSWRERWMRMHDRRATLSAVILLAAYVATLGYGVELLVGLVWGIQAPPYPPALSLCLSFTAVLMLWRLLVRAYFSGLTYGWRQGLLAIPRAVVANLIAMLAARRAVFLYIGQLRGKSLKWDKTTHRFPEVLDSAA